MQKRKVRLVVSLENMHIRASSSVFWFKIEVATTRALPCPLKLPLQRTKVLIPREKRVKTSAGTEVPFAPSFSFHAIRVKKRLYRS